MGVSFKLLVGIILNAKDKTWTSSDFGRSRERAKKEDNPVVPYRKNKTLVEYGNV